MFGPTRVFLALRLHADTGLLAATAAVSATFAATPFLIPVIVDEYGVTIGQAGLLSTAQVGAFALVVFIAGRRLRTSRRFLVGAAVASVALNAASAVAPSFALLVVLRVAAGGASGIMVWLSWAKAMRLAGAMRTMAAAGPLTVFVAAPLLGWVASTSGSPGVFWLLAAVYVPPALLPAGFAAYRHERRRMSPSKSNVVLVVAMGTMTMAGSSLFVYAATVGDSIGMSPLQLSAAFSGNALAGFVAARRGGSAGSGGPWLFGTALCAAGVGVSGEPVLLWAGLVMWGFCFWMATPRILRSIASWSLAPDERVGDTQSAMAAGRAIGPAVGGALVGAGTFAGVTVFSVTGLVVCGLLVTGVARYRRGLPAPAPADG